MANDKQAQRSAAYRAEFIRRWVVCVNRKTEADVLGRLERAHNVSGYIKELIREDMRREMIESIESELRRPIEQIFTK